MFIFPALVVLAVASRDAMADRDVTDHAGRVHLIPSEIERVAAAGAPAEVLLYTLVPERMVGW